jgi:hypothetical protein
MKIKNLKNVCATLALGLLLNGCGSSPNDQGVSFTLLGFGQLTTDESTGRSECSSTTFTNLVDVALSDITEGNGVIIGCPVIQNNMTNVTVRSERVNLSFFIAGATDQPPSSSTAATLVLGPVTSTSGDDTTTDTNAIDSRGAVPVNLVPQATRAWLSENRASLPNPPFSMDITVTVSGVTSAGDQLVSNQALIQANVTNDLPINPSDPSTEPTVDPEA